MLLVTAKLSKQLTGSTAVPAVSTAAQQQQQQVLLMQPCHAPYAAIAGKLG
jgi:hypothetical protein